MQRLIIFSLLLSFCLSASAAYFYDKPALSFVRNVEEGPADNLSDMPGVEELSSDLESMLLVANETMKTGKALKNNDCAKRSKCFCGTPNTNRIVGGTQVRENKYPWTAQLVKGRYYPRLFCGGTLINDRYVVTAAHCVHGNRDQISIRLLQLDRSSRDPGIVRKVIKTIVHPNYSPTTIQNDIALLKLDSEVSMSSTVRPVCLPARNQNYDGKDAVVAGWGLVVENGKTSNYLNEATVPIITNKECRNTRYKNKIADVMLCAGLVKTGGKDACQGDSGGPLIVNEGRYQLAGVVSFGFGCAQPNAPGVYTRVSKFIDWIEKNTNDGCYCN